MHLVRFALLLFPLLLMPQEKPVNDPPPAVLEAATRVLGSGVTVIRYGHLSSPDMTEAIAVTPNSDDRNSGLISRAVVLRQAGTSWNSELTVDKVIRNTQGFVGATSLDQVHPSPQYKLSTFTRPFDDGKTRFVLELTPAAADGKPAGPSVYVSWNPLLGRYQQISLQGYGFEPEVHELMPAPPH